MSTYPPTASLATLRAAYEDVAANNNLYLPAHGFQTGDALRYDIPARYLATGGSQPAPIGGLTPGQDYFAISRGTDDIQLATQGTAFDGSSATVVQTSDNSILVTDTFAIGDQVIYRNGGGTSIGGLTDRNVYFVGVISGNRVKLFNTLELAQAGTTPVDLTTAGSGNGHRLDKQVELTPSKTSVDRQVVHTLVKSDQAAIAGLVDGHTYYVDVANIPVGQQANRFRLLDAPAPNGQVVDINATGLGMPPPTAWALKAWTFAASNRVCIVCGST